MSLSRYLEVLEERERGVNLLPNHVPSTFLFAFSGERIVGRVAIRHVLNDVLQRVGGHIGYVVVPEFRRQGHATAILRLALQFANDKLGLEHVLVTCDDDNVGSIKTIENNGGVLENVISGPDLDHSTDTTEGHDAHDVRHEPHSSGVFSYVIVVSSRRVRRAIL